MHETERVGFGIPSLMDADRGVSLACVHLPLEGVPFRDLMSDGPVEAYQHGSGSVGTPAALNSSRRWALGWNGATCPR